MKIFIFIALFACAAAPCSPQETAPAGLLVITPAGGPAWKKTVDPVISNSRTKLPTEVVYDGTDMRTLQQAVSALESKNVGKIIAVPLFYSSYSETLNQIRFLLGIRKNPSPTFMKGSHSRYPAASLKRVKTKIPLTMTNALDSDTEAEDAVAVKIKPLAGDPSSCSLILLANGPRASKENIRQLKNLENIAERVRKTLSLRDSRALLLLQDNGRKIKEAGENELRSEVRRLSLKGKVIVVAQDLVDGDMDRDVKKLLEGTFYTWGGTAVLSTGKLQNWLNKKMAEGENLAPMRRFDEAGKPLKSGGTDSREEKNND